MALANAERAQSYEIRGYQKAADPWQFVASTNSEDRYGDVIVPEGWDLRNFKRNPIALWNHSQSNPIGTWENVRVKDGQLVATLAPVKPGTSSIADMVRGMVEERVLRAVSVGFIPRQTEPLLDRKGNPTGGFRYLKSELMEISIVAVPANPDALSLARSLGAGPQELRMLFATTGENADAEIHADYQNTRPAAATPSLITRNINTMSLQERIANQEQDLDRLNARLAELAENADDTDALEQVTADIKKARHVLGVNKAAQVTLLADARPAGEGTARAATGGTAKAPAIIRRHGTPDALTLLMRAVICNTASRVRHAPIDDVIGAYYAADRAELDVLTKAAVNPAMTTVTGWAAELVNDATVGFVSALRPNSVFFSATLGVPNYTMGKANKLNLPGWGADSIYGDFVAEGAPIPVKQGLFTSAVLTPYKLSMITVYTMEIAKFSDPAIEALLRKGVVDQTRTRIDQLFLDNTAAVVGLRPAGLQSLAGANTAASSGATIANVITDITAAINNMAGNGNGSRLVWIMNSQRAMGLSLKTNAAGNFQFADQLNSGNLNGIPVVHSLSVPASVVFLVDADFLAATYDTVPALDLSEHATLHMESTAATVPPTANTVAPLAYGKGLAPGGAAGTAALTDFAQPQRSMFQTASTALRMIWDIGWSMSRPNSVYTITGCAW